MDKGFIPIKRSLFEHFLFKERRTFSRFEAWLDLIQMASFTDENMELIGGKLIGRNRGEVIASLRFLMQRWNWSMHKVSDYLELLRSQEMVVVDKENGVTKILLVNFEKHNVITEKSSKGDRKGDSKTRDSTAFNAIRGAPVDTGMASPKEQRGSSDGTNIKKDNKGNKEEGSVGAIAPAPAHPYSKDEEDMFGAFKAWIDKYAPKVNQLKEPLNIKQFFKLRQDFPGESGKMLIQEVLLSMHNKKTLLKDYESANLTLRSWINLRKRNGNIPSGGNSEVNAKLKAAGKNKK